MRAVFMCTEGSYKQVGYWDVNGIIPVYGCSKDEELDTYKSTCIVGYEVKLPEEAPVLENVRFYNFTEGKDHNQLTLTDAKEIYNMRKWIQRRGSCNNDFVEIYSDEEAEHITDDMFRDPVAVPKEPVRAKEPEDYEGYTDWDIKYLKDLRSR